MAAYPGFRPLSFEATSTQHVIRVRRRNLRWEVALDGVTRRMIDWLCTRERAIEHALEMARSLASTESGEPVRVTVEDLPGVDRMIAIEAPRLRAVR